MRKIKSYIISDKFEFGDFQLYDPPNQKTHKNNVVANKNRHQSFLVNYSKKPL